MNNGVKVRIAATVFEPDENGKIIFEGGRGFETNVPAEEVHRMMLEAQSYKEALEFLNSTGAYVELGDSKVIIVESLNGCQIFVKDEPDKKITIDKPLTEQAITEILSVEGSDIGHAVEEILVANGIIENEAKEVEEVISYEDGTREDKRASGVEPRDISNVGDIAVSRHFRDSRKEDDRNRTMSEGLDR